MEVVLLSKKLMPDIANMAHMANMADLAVMAVKANDAQNLKSLFLIKWFFFEEVDISISDALWQLIGFLAVRHNISQYSAREKQKRRFCVTYPCFPLASVFHSYLPSIVVSFVMHCFFLFAFYILE